MTDVEESWVVFPSLLASLGLLIAMHFHAHSVPINYILLSSFTILQALTLGCVVALFELQVILEAALLTTVIVFSLFIYTLQSRRDFVKHYALGFSLTGILLLASVMQFMYTPCITENKIITIVTMVYNIDVIFDYNSLTKVNSKESISVLLEGPLVLREKIFETTELQSPNEYPTIRKFMRFYIPCKWIRRKLAANERVCGLVCIGIGTWLVLDKYAIDNLALATAKVQGYEEDAGLRDLATKPTAVRQIGYLLLLGGLLVIFVAFLGCCGAAKEWRPLLCCYATCLMVILATEIAAAIYAALHSHMFEKDFREILRASLRMYNGTDHSRRKHSDGMLVKAAWDKIMLEKSCCGVDSRIGEFNESGWFSLTRGRHPFPPACCPPDRHGRLMQYCPTISRYGDGCIFHMFYRNRVHFSAVFGIFFVLASVEDESLRLNSVFWIT
uniref:Tetraspanin n=1 Tax=Heterorhabditis bacteriophora TaxID=37862 RepID=A0A1I7WPS0_HETBA